MPDYGVDRNSAPPSRDDAPLTILYRDAHIVAIDKPAGLLVHRSDIDRSETRFAVQLLRDQIGCRVWPAHRLDRGTSGVLLFGLSAEAAATLGRLFESGAIAKRYLAVVRGHPPERGSIDHPLSRRRDAYEFAGDAASVEPQPALTHFRRLAAIELPEPVDRYPVSRYALLELEPVSGRRHQLRRHLKHIAHPIIGDATYGKGRHNRFFAERFGCRRLLLACISLAFTHPAGGGRLEITTPVSGEFAATLAQLGWSDAAAQ